MITFTAYGTPKPQPRPRAFARKFGNTYSARVYDAGTAEGWKSAVAIAAKPFIPVDPITEPLCVSMDFRMMRPKGHFTKSGGLTKSAPAHPCNKDDLDNLAKAVLDALTQIGMWRDDGQVVSLKLSKAYVTERPGAVVGIEGVN